jgi:hypothetical protein
MEATIGDKICIHGNTVGHADKHGEIIEVRGDRGEPPYVVRFPDGQERTIFPGPDAYIIPRQRQSPLLPGGAPGNLRACSRSDLRCWHSWRSSSA